MNCFENQPRTFQPSILRAAFFGSTAAFAAQGPSGANDQSAMQGEGGASGSQSQSAAQQRSGGQQSQQQSSGNQGALAQALPDNYKISSVEYPLEPQRGLVLDVTPQQLQNAFGQPARKQYVEAIPSKNGHGAYSLFAG